jgi:hypothetical protein
MTGTAIGKSFHILPRNAQKIFSYPSDAKSYVKMFACSLKILTITFLCQQFTLFNVLTGFEVVI